MAEECRWLFAKKVDITDLIHDQWVCVRLTCAVLCSLKTVVLLYLQIQLATYCLPNITLPKFLIHYVFTLQYFSKLWPIFNTGCGSSLNAKSCTLNSSCKTLRAKIYNPSLHTLQNHQINNYKYWLAMNSMKTKRRKKYNINLKLYLRYDPSCSAHYSTFKCKISAH